MDEQLTNNEQPEENSQPSINMGNTAAVNAASPERVEDAADAADAAGSLDHSVDGSKSEDGTTAQAMMDEAESDQQPMTDNESLKMPDVQRAEFGDLGAGGSCEASNGNIELLLDVNLPVAIELGRTHMSIKDILELGAGSIVELDKLAGEPVDILVNSRLLAKGEVVVLDENFGVRITSLVSPRERLENLGA